MTGGLWAEVIGRLVWWVPLEGEEWFWLCFWLLLLLVSPLGGGGWRVAMLGGVPGGEVMRRSLLVGLTQVSAMTHLDSLLHA